jgi:hypothetical protein
MQKTKRLFLFSTVSVENLLISMLKNRKRPINSGDDFKLPKSYSIAQTFKYQQVTPLSPNFSKLRGLQFFLLYFAGDINTYKHAICSTGYDTPPARKPERPREQPELQYMKRSLPCTRHFLLPP